MKHTDSSAIMAYLDGELPAARRAALDAHAAVCALCRQEFAELKSIGREFTDAVSLLNGRIPMLSARAAIEQRVPGSGLRARRFVTASILKAAAVLLLLTGAASAAIPGTPLRRLVERAVARLTGETAVVATTPAPVEDISLFVQGAEGAGTFVDPLAGAVRVSVHSPAQNARIAVRQTEGDRVLVRALGANESVRFRPRDGAVDVYGVQTGLLIELPRRLRAASVDVDGRSYYVKDGAGEPVLGPGAATSPEGVVFRLNNR